MKASVSYNDLIGTVAADVSDEIATKFRTEDIEAIGKYFEIDENRFQIIGISIYGVKNMFVSLICIDKDRSENQPFITKMNVNITDEDKNFILEILFKRLNIVLHSKFNEDFNKIVINEESNYEDFHFNNEE